MSGAPRRGSDWRTDEDLRLLLDAYKRGEDDPLSGRADSPIPQQHQTVVKIVERNPDHRRGSLNGGYHDGAAHEEGRLLRDEGLSRSSLDRVHPDRDFVERPHPRDGVLPDRDFTDRRHPRNGGGGFRNEFEQRKRPRDKDDYRSAEKVHPDRLGIVERRLYEEENCRVPNSAHYDQADSAERKRPRLEDDGGSVLDRVHPDRLRRVSLNGNGHAADRHENFVEPLRVSVSVTESDINKASRIVSGGRSLKDGFKKSLLDAIENGDIEEVKFLLKDGTESITFNDQQVVRLAIESDRLEMIAALVNSGRLSLLGIQSGPGSKMLRDRGVSLNALCGDSSALYLAAYRDQAEDFRSQLQTNPQLDVGAMSECLKIALRKGNVQVLRVLLESGHVGRNFDLANVAKASDNNPDVMALMKGFWEGKEDANPPRVERIDQADADRELLNACESGDTDRAVSIISKHQVSSQTIEKAIKIASTEGHAAIVERLLLCDGVNVKVAGGAALVAATAAKQPGVVAALLRNRDVPPDAKDNLPIRQAVESGDIQSVKLLLATDKVSVHQYGSRAVRTALDKGFDDVIDALKAYNPSGTRSRRHQERMAELLGGALVASSQSFDAALPCSVAYPLGGSVAASSLGYQAASSIASHQVDILQKEHRHRPLLANSQGALAVATAAPAALASGGQ
ncbi:hypothetical protein HK101_005263 [Irineochytrium annulatum]|nr:hypothetical protein HK101_005263 [Irineochytrium annulatum]